MAWTITFHGVIYQLPIRSTKKFFLNFDINLRACRLSVSTLKRIWANQLQRLPHTSTLDALSQVAFSKDWQRLKANRLLKSHTEFKVSTKKNTWSRSRFKKIVVLVVFGLPLLLIFSGTDRRFKKSREEVMDVNLSYKKSVANTLPNTVIFNYDIEELDAKRFFLQQSWDRSRRVEIFQGTSERTDVYYIPGYFTAKLVADDRVVQETPVHITYDDWFIAARQPMSNIITFDKELWAKEEYLALDEKPLETKGVNLNEKFQLAFYHVKDFGLEGDNLTYSTSFKMEPLEAVDCPMINVHIQGTTGYYWVMLGHRGCESELHLTVGEKKHNGKTQDLTMFGADMYQWNEVKIDTNHKNVVLELNGKHIFSTSYKETIGPVMEISYFFNGIGMIDNVELQNQNHEMVFSDDFTSIAAPE
ncbi:hypothetical protein L0P88_05530 [Muricauda sp. SCSIO 64092]|uniref:hypothetical protein n=1 Tax=Allomuricauda sp. SCSIO 64092 TaxID=2908842 RepID=UPI001FF6DA14|nr:hypothetical protein [Muricauda sp. SCSIO 64092]UOY08013.1 hypothetical protein L0P88_05530 [Muricauda sp. SCSIO 64092]